jgi:hypothetical protein
MDSIVQFMVTMILDDKLRVARPHMYIFDVYYHFSCHKESHTVLPNPATAVLDAVDEATNGVLQLKEPPIDRYRERHD